MKIIHKTASRAGMVGNTNTLADDWPHKFEKTTNNEVVVKVRGGKYGDVNYEVVLNQEELTRIQKAWAIG